MPSDSANFAEALIAGAPDGIIFADAEGIITRWNPGAARMFGYTAAEAIGSSLDLIIPDNLRARHWHGYRETMRTGQTRYGDGQILAVPATRKDGTICRWNSPSWRSPTRPDGCAASVRSCAT